MPDDMFVNTKHKDNTFANENTNNDNTYAINTIATSLNDTSSFVGDTISTAQDVTKQMIQLLENQKTDEKNKEVNDNRNFQNYLLSNKHDINQIKKTVSGKNAVNHNDINKVNSTSYMKEYAALHVPKRFGGYSKNKENNVVIDYSKKMFAQDTSQIATKKVSKNTTKKVSKEMSKKIAKESSKMIAKESSKATTKAAITASATAVGSVVPGVGNAVGYFVGNEVGDTVGDAIEKKDTITTTFKKAQNLAKQEYIKSEQANSILDEDTSRVKSLVKMTLKFFKMPLRIIAATFPIWIPVVAFFGLLITIVFLSYYMMSSAILMSGGGAVSTNQGTSEGASYLEDMVYYCQWSGPWADDDYGYGTTITTSGCGVTCMAMCVATFADPSVTPSHTAKLSLSCGAREKDRGTNMHTLIPNACKLYNLHYEEINGEKEVKKALEDGKLVVWGAKGHSEFSSSNAGHVLIMRKYSDGNYYMADPNKAQKNTIPYSWNVVSSNSVGYFIAVWGDKGRLVTGPQNLDTGTGDNKSNGGQIGPVITAEKKNIGESLGTFTITAYCTCKECCGEYSGGNSTASGTVPTENRTLAVDTSVIPMGTKLVINNQVYVAEDRGGAIVGKRIDMFFYTHKQALEWGRRDLEVFYYKE